MLSKKIVIGCSLLAAGVLAGVAIPLSLHGVSIKPQAAAAAAADSSGVAKTSWPKNALGQTYGDFTAVTDPNNAPDLVSVWVTHDKIGYVESKYLFPKIPAGTSPAQLSANLSRAASTPASVPAVDLDGNVIGDFKLG